MAVGDIYQANIVGRLHGQMTINTFHYREVTTGSGIGSAALAAGVSLGIVSELKTAVSNEWNLERVSAQKILPLPPLLGTDDTSAAGPGAILTESLPTSVAAVVSKRTLLAGRANRGRCYFAGVPSASEADSELTTTSLAMFQDVADEMALGISQGGYVFTPVVFHRGSGTTTDIASCLARQVLRNQRRRQIGKGA